MQHLSRQHLSVQSLSRKHLPILAISQLLLNHFGPNINGRFEGPYLPDAFMVTVTFVQATFVLGTFVQINNISATPDPIFTKLFGGQEFVSIKFCYIQTFLNPKLLWTKLFLEPRFFLLNFSAPKFFEPKTLVDQNF